MPFAVISGEWKHVAERRTFIKERSRNRMTTDKESKATTFEWPIVENYAGRQAYGTQSVDWEERINMDRMRKYRFGSAKAEMIKAKVGAVLCLNESNIMYCTSTSSAFWTTPSSGLRYALFPATAECGLSLIHISEPTRLGMISYAVFC